MSALGTKLRQLEGGLLAFWCPGCGSAHMLRVSDDPGRGWSFNDDPERPTFSPSVLVQSGHYAPGHTGDCWCDYEARRGEPAPFACVRCHLYVTHGQLIYLHDSTHALAGQTVDLPDFPADYGFAA